MADCVICEEPGAHVSFDDGDRYQDVPVHAGCVQKIVDVGGKDYSYRTVPLDDAPVERVE